MRKILEKIGDLFLGRSSEKMVKEFIEVFPGRCMICASHDYGVREGHLSFNARVEEHTCIENEKE